MAAKQQFTSVWAREARPGRTDQQPGLSRTQIVRTAIELLDAEGLDALSMRRLAARLGSGATSIYWHVANKDELLELVMDEVVGEVATTGFTVTSWRAAATAYAYGLRHMILGHPWMARLIGTLPSMGPNALRVSEMMITAFLRAGFEGSDVDFSVALMGSYTLGATLPEVAWQSNVADMGIDEEQWADQVQTRVHTAAAEYPELAAMFERYAQDDLRSLRAMSFDYGLVCVLDGLEARLPGQAGKKARTKR